MLRSLRRVCATALHHVFAVPIAVAMATSMIWMAFVSSVAAQEQPPLTIPNANSVDCRRNAAACLAASGTAASAPQVSQSALQSAIRDIRDNQQDKASSGDKAPPQGLGARQALSSESPMMGLTRSPAALPSPIAAWVQGYVDREWRDSNLGFLDGRTTTTAGAMGGIDYTSYRLFAPNDALVIGLLAGVMEMRSTSVVDVRTRIDGPSLGVYGVYVNGGFSVDANAKVDFLSLDQSAALPISADLRTYAMAANVNYKFDVGGGWIEPTAGAIYTVTRWDSGMSGLDGHTVRVQGGVRFGQSFNVGAV